MRKLLTLAVPVVAAGAAHAQTIEVSVEIPKLNVSEYHRPYVAIWIEKAGGGVAADLSVWYDIKLKDEEGEKWLKDIRQWWRRSGRALELPADGLSSATKPPGVNKVTFSAASKPLKDLPPGDYKLMVEASREVGGREMLEIPFTWGAADISGSAKGSEELGTVTLKLVK